MLRPSDSKCLPSWAASFPFFSCEPGDLLQWDDGRVPRRLCTKGTGIIEQKGDCSIHWQEEVASSTALLRGRFQSHKTLRALSAFPEDQTYDLPGSWWWKAPLHGGDWCSHKRKWLFPQILQHRHSWLSELNAPPHQPNDFSPNLRCSNYWPWLTAIATA